MVEHTMGIPPKIAHGAKVYNFNLRAVPKE